MWGAYLRAPLYIGIAVLAAAILDAVSSFMLPYIGADTYIGTAIVGIVDNALFIMLIAVGAGLLARAVTESQTGVR